MNSMLVYLVFLLLNFFAACQSSDEISIMAENARLIQNRIPLFIERENPDAVSVSFSVPAGIGSVELNAVEIFFSEGSQTEILETVSVSHRSDGQPAGNLFGKSDGGNALVRIEGTQSFAGGHHFLFFNFSLKKDAALEKSFQIEKVELVFAGEKRWTLKPEKTFTYRPALVLRAAGQDQCDTYRIPGLITTNSGALVAVYDNRYNNSKDLQEHIDIGMSRSLDGGQSWEPMKVIMDRGQWGGLPEELNGVGDPCVLYDHLHNTIWVAALWLHGFSKDQMAWWVSKPGLSPQETGQFLLVKSTDDGLTWSEPVNITAQIKDPSWQLLLQGPGRGITLNDGTLVFPAQFKADIGVKAIDGGQYTSHSTIVYSRDGGQSWSIGSGAKSNTTEAQVVQLTDGRLMLNMRDDRNRKEKGELNGRAVAVSADLGKTWEVHPSSNSLLPEPNCMASLIAADVRVDGGMKKALFFSNPDNKEQRTNMTIKASLDEGLTWPDALQVELNETAGYGYSCMTMTDENTVGILYEGVKELYFQKINVSELIPGK